MFFLKAVSKAKFPSSLVKQLGKPGFLEVTFPVHLWLGAGCWPQFWGWAGRQERISLRWALPVVSPTQGSRCPFQSPAPSSEGGALILLLEIKTLTHRDLVNLLMSQSPMGAAGFKPSTPCLQNPTPIIHHLLPCVEDGSGLSQIPGQELIRVVSCY